LVLEFVGDAERSLALLRVCADQFGHLGVVTVHRMDAPRFVARGLLGGG